MQYVNGANIPQELKDRPQWVLWKNVVRDGQGTKVPFATSGICAKSNDASTWDTYEIANRRYAVGNWEGIGYVFSKDDPYTGVDLDGCRNPENGVIAQWAKDIILELSTYAEVSPSKSGVKLWVRGNWPYDGGHKVILEDVERITEKTPAIEVYDSVRFFTVTGNRLKNQCEISDRQDVLDSLRKRFWKETPAIHNNAEWRSEASVLERARKYLATIPGAVSGADGHGVTFKAACAMVLGFELPESDALSLLCEWNQTCQPPWSERELKHKVEDAGRQNGDRGYLRNVAPKNYDRVKAPEHKPVIQEPELPKSDITVTTMDDAARNYLAAVTGGHIRLIELGLPDLDYAIGGGVEPGEMVIFAARPGHGKSMCAQQVAYNLTANGIAGAFFSEEMPNLMLGKRAIHYASAVPNEHWSNRADIVSGDIEKHFRNKKPLYIVEGCKTAVRIAHEIGRFVQEHNIGFAVVDYAQLLGAPGKTRTEIVTNVSISLKQAALANKIPIIVLCQLNRAIEGRGGFLPVMSDLKESGQLEQDADVIIFQLWPHKIDPEKPKENYQLIVAKNKSRPINQYAVDCIIRPGRQMLVYENARDQEPPPPPPADVCDEFDQIGNGADSTGLDLNFGP